MEEPILLLEGIFNCDDVKVAEEFDLTVAVHCAEQRELIVAAKPNRPIDIYLKMNSGMNRLGFAPEDFREAWKRASASPGIGAVSLMTHFANADEGEVDWQLHSFDRATRDIPGARSLSNSAATMWHKRAHREWVRPGIVLYGSSPSGRAIDIAAIPLRASMTLSSEIIGTQTMLAGETVGYARTYKAERETRIGVVACG